MNTRIKNLLLGCVLVSLFFACNSEPKHEVKTIVKEVKVVKNYRANKTSELALLMRKMYLEADSIKHLIVSEKGTISEDFITELDSVHTAIPTDPKVKTAEFDAFNQSLIARANAIKRNPENKIEEFNRFVNSCIACHQRFCPGPIKRIKKLKID